MFQRLSPSEITMDDQTEMTDIDEIDPELVSASLSQSKIRSGDLRAILTGNIKKTKPKTEEIPPMKPIETFDDSSEEVPEFDSSFTESKSDQYRRDYDVLELEKKIYKQEVQSVSARDIFSRIKKPAEPTVVDPEPIVVEEEEAVDNTKQLEAKFYGQNYKRTTAKDFFKSLKSKEIKPVLKAKKKQDIKTLLVTLKVNLDALAEIKKYDNPFKTRGNRTLVDTSNVDVAKSDFFAPKAAKSNSLFDSMMTASKNTVQLTPLQKLKELLPPTLTRDQFHVYEPWLYESANITSLSSRHRSHPDTILPEVEPILITDNNFSQPSKYITKVSRDLSKTDLVRSKSPNLEQHSQLLSIFDKFIVNERIDKNALWIHLFQPETMNDLLMDDSNKRRVDNWIKNSFQRLKAQSLKNPRNVLIQQQKKKKQRKLLNGFIVDDTYLDESDTEEEIFVPLLILQGSTGSCKSSAIYSAMRELNGYVHEINTGMDRGRKDIYNSLKEFCTTQLVHAQYEAKSFQQGIVLLEEVNILFEQDKSFWLAIQDILNISRRPVVVTCESLLNIPKLLIEFAEDEDSIIYVDDSIVSKDLVKKYLWLCAVSQNFDLDDSLLEEIVTSSFNGHNYDIRKCLMECQLVCGSAEKGHITQLAKRETVQSIPQDDLFEIANSLENLSCADIISTNSSSLLAHAYYENELIDIQVLDEACLTQPRLPFELDLGRYLESRYQETMSTEVPEPHFTHKQLRDRVVSFVASRSKKLPKFVQELQTARRTTRSFTSTPQPDELSDSVDSVPNSWIPDVTGVSESSFIHNIGSRELVLDFLPICRYWITFQISLNRFEKDTLEKGGQSLKKFLGYRDFQDGTTELLDTIPKH